MNDEGWNDGIGSYSCGKNIILKLIDVDNGFRESHVAGKLSNYDTSLRSSVDYISMI